MERAESLVTTSKSSRWPGLIVSGLPALFLLVDGAAKLVKPGPRLIEGAFPIIFPIILGALIWLGLYLRDPQLRAFIPLRARP